VLLSGRQLEEFCSATRYIKSLTIKFPFSNTSQEISTYFPRKVLWRAFLCSLCAAVLLRALNPTGTGKLVLFETNYGINYDPIHYLVFVFLGISGGLFGGVFCKANFLWSKSFRKYSIIKNHPVFELSLVVLVTALFQYPNPLTREAGDVIIKNLLVDCRHPEGSWVCTQEALEDKSSYYGWLAYGTSVKLVLTIITFGCKVPSGIIIPALDAGALFGRLIGQLIPDISPGIFAMVGAAAFLAGVSRMTVSLTVIMFELTGEVDYIPPFMIAILVAKWVADALSSEGVYDLAQTVLGHPFLDPEHALSIVRDEGSLVEDLIPPAQTMREITVDVGPECKVSKSLLATKLSQLKARGLMDAGLVLVDGNAMLHGYLAQGELDFAIHEEGLLKDNEPVDLLEGIMSTFVDRTPLTISAKAPMEYVAEMFGKLGLRHLIVLEEGTGKVVGVIIKKRLVLYLEGLHH
jgi:chloride channel 3/4/5